MAHASQRPPVQGTYFEQKAISYIETSLAAYFDYRENEQCFRLKGYLQSFVAATCSEMEAKIAELVKLRIDGKTHQDWVSWHLEAVKYVLASTFEKFSSLIARAEPFDLSASNKIPCSTAERYFGKIGACYDAAYQQYVSFVTATPKSSLHIRKKAGQTWKPYLMEHFPCSCERVA